MENPAVLPETLHVVEEVALVLGHGDGDASRDGEMVALRLVAVMVGVQDPVDARDADLSEPVQASAAAKVDEHAAGGVPRVEDHVDVAGVPKAVEVLGDALEPT